MSQSVKLKDGSYIDASGVWDNTQGKSQEAVNSAQATTNAAIQHIKTGSITGTTNSGGDISLPVENVIRAHDSSHAYPVLFRGGRVWRVYDRDSMAPKGSLEVTITYVYYE